MTVTSAIFFLCAAIAALVYRWLPQRTRKYWLLAVSIGFLATWSWKFVIVLGVLTLINYWFGLRADPDNAHSRRWVIAGIVLNVAALIIFKYSNFYLPDTIRLLGKLGISLSDGLQILLPVGLSFLTVQWISYLLDVGNKMLPAQRDPVKFSLYAFYFPRLLSGPVERARIFFPRLDAPLKVDRALLERSLVLIVTGLFRKLVFADPMFGMIPADAFTAPANYAGQHLFLWLLAYGFALYNDFAGYTMIVRGVSLWFGIELTNNFNLPYLSRNFSEFWNRWHISLSAWLRDYIFYPLSLKLVRRNKNQKAFFNFVLPPMVTMFVSALWHGLSWSMLLWGGLHGLYLVAERIPSLIKPQKPVNERPRWRQGLGIVTTFIFAMLAWVPFKTSIGNTLTYWASMLDWDKPDLFLLKRVIKGKTLLLSWTAFNIPNPILCLVLAGAIVFDLLQHRSGNELFVQRWPRWAQILLIVILLLVVVLAAFTHEAAPFVYQTF
jgi:D-alanyl-lipoteichoic acid acyltransferase DltB (MBOAT superfamily)